MKKRNLFISLALTICAFFTVLGFASCGNTGKNTENNVYNITESYTNISVDVRTANVHFGHTAYLDEPASVTCNEEKKVKHSVEVIDDTLVIKVIDTRKWYEKIFNFFTPNIHIIIPVGDYGSLSVKATTGNVTVANSFQFDNIDISVSTGNIKNYASANENVKIKASTGDIQVEDISANALNCSVSTGNITLIGVNCTGYVQVEASTGNIKLTNVSCKNFISESSTGNVTLTSVVAEEKFDIETDTGNVKFDRCDAAEIYVETDTGDVKGSLRSDKIFIVETDTGRIDVPKTTTGGKCEITTDTGDIKITIFEE